MPDMTPEEEEALYNKLWGPGAPKPVSSPHKHSVLYRAEDSDEGPAGEPIIERQERTDRSVMEAVAPEQRRAVVLCRNVKGRPTMVAVVTATPAGDFGFVAHSNGDGVNLGYDFEVDCRCGITHRFDGGRLRSAVLATRKRPGKKAPSIDVRDVERVSGGPS